MLPSRHHHTLWGGIVSSNLALRSHGENVRDLIANLSGHARVSLEKAHVALIPVFGKIHDIEAHCPATLDGTDLSVAVTIADGMVQILDFSIQSAPPQAKGSGIVDLMKRTANLRWVNGRRSCLASARLDGAWNDLLAASAAD